MIDLPFVLRQVGEFWPTGGINQLDGSQPPEKILLLEGIQPESSCNPGGASMSRSVRGRNPAGRLANHGPPGRSPTMPSEESDRTLPFNRKGFGKVFIPLLRLCIKLCP